LTVEAKCDSSGLHVSFTDDGPGIPPEHHEEVFDIFHQIDVDDTGEVPGLGLGLWWTREVILVHGGDVVLTSPVAGGRGTRIDCVFPRAILVEPVEDTKVHKVEPRGKTTDPPTDLDLEPLDVSRL
jgi:signal transduction histidine kinase